MEVCAVCGIDRAYIIHCAACGIDAMHDLAFMDQPPAPPVGIIPPSPAAATEGTTALARVRRPGRDEWRDGWRPPPAGG